MSENFGLVIVYWRDAASDDRWQKISDAKEMTPEPCRTVGWLLNQNETHYVIAGTVGGDECSQIFSIPKAWADKIEAL